MSVAELLGVEGGPAASFDWRGKTIRIGFSPQVAKARIEAWVLSWYADRVARRKSLDTPEVYAGKLILLEERDERGDFDLGTPAFARAIETSDGRIAFARILVEIGGTILTDDEWCLLLIEDHAKLVDAVSRSLRKSNLPKA